MIVCVDTQYAIGYENNLLYNFKEDMIRFKNLTLGKKVVMGRKTWESLPKKLPNRENIVITNNFISDADLCCNVQEIINRSKQEDYIIIGGASIYYQFKDYVDIIELTYVRDCKKFDTDIKWLENHLKDYTIKNENNIIDIDRTDNLSKKISFITYIK